MPSHFEYAMAGISDEEFYKETFDFWNNVYTFSMKAAKKV